VGKKETNTLACYDTAKITAVKRVAIEALGSGAINFQPSLIFVGTWTLEWSPARSPLG